MNLTAFDFETSGDLPEYALQPWRIKQGKAWATSLAVIHQTGDQDYVRTGGLNPTRDMMAEMMEEALRRDQPITAWNAAFDIAVLLAYGLDELVYRSRWLDGMLLWRHFEVEPEYDFTRAQKKSYALQECINLHLPQMGGYKDEVDFHNPDPEVRRKLHQINIRDTVCALQLTEFWYDQLNPRQQKVARIEAMALPMVAKANLEGLLVDTLATNDLNLKLMKDALDALDKFSAEDGVTPEVVASPTKLAVLLFDQWKLPVLKQNTGKKTGKVSRSTDKEVLHELAFHDKRVAPLRDYREAVGNRKKFADNILESVAYNEDGCTHPGGIIFGTYTGRLTYASQQGKGIHGTRQTGFAIHQEKNDPFYRSVIIAPQGYKLVEFDASGQEFRWMAIASEDETMLQMCLPGEDAHSFMGAQIEGIGYRELMRRINEEDLLAKPIRRLGKLANLSLQYRTSARKLRVVARVDYGLPMELPQALHIHQTYLDTYKGMTPYWKAQINKVKKLGYVENFAGRRVKVEGDWSTLEWSMGSTGINYLIQSTGGDQKYLALSVLRPYIVKHDIQFRWDMHDGLYFYVPDAKVERAAVEMKHLLDNLPYEKAWGFSPPIPLPWDCKTGQSWGGLKGWVG